MLIFTSAVIFSYNHLAPVIAHQVKITSDVGATLHIEPNDTPRSGEASLAWFALTRKGGKVISLSECNCQLLVYAQPYVKGEPALLEPNLKPIKAERFRGIPGAEITFPKPGSYQLQLQGKAKQNNSFKPFNLKFNVTVATGTSSPSSDTTQVLENSNTQVEENQGWTFPVWAIAIPLFSISGIIFVALRRKQTDQGDIDSR
uniref:hypothetical protein n=1 Tax=Calothrix sp. 336/3 TaxID=1337936 RepID=UPI0011876268|nr:hypothetical protein [Calothrix sp. 336/3]